MACARLDDDTRCKPAVDEDPIRRPVLALVAEPEAARVALAAPEVGSDGDAFSDLDSTHTGAYLGRDPDELVAENDADVRRVPGRDAEDVQVGAADAARLDFEQDVVVGRERGLGALLHRERADVREDRGLHEPPSP
jgi:hypothetical protein